MSNSEPTAAAAVITRKRRRKTGELAPKEAVLRITHLQFATVLANFIMAAKSPQVGYENAKKTLEEFCQELDSKFPKVSIKIGVLEDLLWAVNLRAETGDFWSPQDKGSFDKFLKRLFFYARLDGERLMLDRNYNTISYESDLEIKQQHQQLTITNQKLGSE